MILEEELINFLQVNNLSSVIDATVNVDCRFEINLDDKQECEFVGNEHLKVIQDRLLEIIKQLDAVDSHSIQVVYGYWIMMYALDQKIAQFAHAMEGQHFLETQPEDLRAEIKESIFRDILERFGVEEK
jgi:hypothetical protein